MLTVPFAPHAPTTALELRTYKKVPSAELADMRERALHLATKISVLDSLHSGDEFLTKEGRNSFEEHAPLLPEEVALRPAHQITEK